MEPRDGKAIPSRGRGRTPLTGFPRNSIPSDSFAAPLYRLDLKR